MSNKKAFGIWMDNHSAIILGSTDVAEGPLSVVAHVNAEDHSSDSGEKNANNKQQSTQGKFFKEVASHLTNATDVHVTGTGQVQEQFLHYLADTPQFKHSKTAHSTSNKMSDEKLVEFINGKI